MRIACWIPEVTNTHSQYVTLIAFPLQQWLYERASLCEETEETNKMQQLDVYHQLLSQHVSGIIMPIFRRTKALLLHLVCCSGSAGCGW